MYILKYHFTEIIPTIYNESFKIIVYEIINSNYACDTCIVSTFGVAKICVCGKLYSQNTFKSYISIVNIFVKQ